MQDINEALNRLPQEVVDARNQRLKRASDISLKKEYMSPEMQALQTPYASYLQACPLRLATESTTPSCNI